MHDLLDRRKETEADISLKEKTLIFDNENGGGVLFNLEDHLALSLILRLQNLINRVCNVVDLYKYKSARCGQLFITFYKIILGSHDGYTEFSGIFTFINGSENGVSNLIIVKIDGEIVRQVSLNHRIKLCSLHLGKLLFTGYDLGRGYGEYDILSTLDPV